MVKAKDTNTLVWAGGHIARGMLSGVGTLLVYALVAVMILHFASLGWLRKAFGIRFSNSEFATDESPPLYGGPEDVQR